MQLAVEILYRSFLWNLYSRAVGGSGRRWDCCNCWIFQPGVTSAAGSEVIMIAGLLAAFVCRVWSLILDSDSVGKDYFEGDMAEGRLFSRHILDRIKFKIWSLHTDSSCANSDDGRVSCWVLPIIVLHSLAMPCKRDSIHYAEILLSPSSSAGRKKQNQCLYY